MERLTDTGRRDLDETRRLIYAVQLRPFGVAPSGEILGTIVNALRHHSDLMDDRSLAEFVLSNNQTRDLIPYIDKITALLDADKRAQRKPVD